MITRPSELELITQREREIETFIHTGRKDRPRSFETYYVEARARKQGSELYSYCSAGSIASGED